MSESASNPAGGVDLRALKNALARHWALACSIILGFLLAAGTYTAFATPIFKAKASVLIDNNARSIVPEASAGVALSRDVTRAQRILARSRPVLQRAAEVAGTARWGASGHPADPLAPLGKKTAWASIEGQLLVLEVLHPDPRRAQTLANAWSAAFVEEMTRRERASSIYTRDFLDQQIPRLRADWIKKQQALQNFQVRNNFDPGEAKTDPVRQRYADLARKLTEAKIRLANLKSEAKAWEGSKTRLDLLFQRSRARRNPNILAYEKLIQAQRKALLELRQRYVAGSETLRRTERTVAGLEALSREALAAIANQIQVDRDAASDEVRELSALFSEAQKQYEALQSKAAKYQLLAFEASMARQQYENLAKRKQHAEVAGRVNYSYAQPWEYAERPQRPYRPSWPRNMALGLLLGLLCAAAAVYLCETFDDTVRSSAHLQGTLGLNVVGAIPLLERPLSSTPAYRLVLEHPAAPVVESLRALRTSLAVAYGPGAGEEDTGAKIFFITSPSEKDGKSFLASNLSILFAQAGKRTLLVDLDLHRKTLSRALGMSQAPGLGSLRKGPKSLFELARTREVPGLFFLPAGPDLERPSALLESAGFEHLLEEARRDFDVVLIDTPPVLAVADARGLAAKCDLGVVVVRSRHARLAQVERTAEALRQSNARECVYVVNGISAADAEAGGYGYKYGYAYGRNSHEKTEAGGGKGKGNFHRAKITKRAS